ncbi:MAG: hypothetical protein DMG80_17215 [Acidobacteria bacterium]|nr:MAG: hypothetical protein DMG80_17215 [Acidobacteriota bacterium]
MFWLSPISAADMLSLLLQWADGRLNNMAFLCHVLPSSGNDCTRWHASLPSTPRSGKLPIISGFFMLLLCDFKYVRRRAYAQTRKRYIPRISRIHLAPQFTQGQRILIISIHIDSVVLSMFVFLYHYHVVQSTISNLRLKCLPQNMKLNAEKMH